MQYFRTLKLYILLILDIFTKIYLSIQLLVLFPQAKYTSCYIAIIVKIYSDFNCLYMDFISK